MGHAEDGDRGLVLKPKKSGSGLYVDYVGWWGGHDEAKKSGVQKNDEILEFADPKSETEIIAHVMQTTRAGDPIQIKVKRGGREHEMTFRAK